MLNNELLQALLNKVNPLQLAGLALFSSLVPNRLCQDNPAQGVSE